MVFDLIFLKASRKMSLLNHFKLLRPGRSYFGLKILNITGLALGLASVVYISIWISHELSYDRFHKDSDRIFRIESLLNFGGEPVVWEVAPAPAAESVRSEFPEVENSVAMQKGYTAIVKVNEDVFYENNLYYSTPEFFDIFSFRLLSGDHDKVLKDPYSVVISAGEAARFFGDRNPLGNTIILDNKYVLTISGIIEDAPSNSHLRIDYLVPFSLLKEGGSDLSDWHKLDYLTYIKLKKNIDPEQFNQKIVNYLPTKIENPLATLFINPITRIHLYKDPGFRNFSNHLSQKGPITRVYLFGLVGLMLLLLACINFINLETATATQRAREIGIRKAAGAGKGRIMTHVFIESIIQTLVSMLLAVILVFLIHPLFFKVTGLEPGNMKLFNAGNILICLGLTLITGILSGFYPAVVLSSFRPAEVLKPSAHCGKEKAGIRKTLVISQLVLSSLFIFIILIINHQTNYMQRQDPGFDGAGVMVVAPAQAVSNSESINALASDIERLPGVTRVAIGGNIPVNMGNFNTLNKWEGNTEGRELRFHMMQVDDNYIDLLGLEIISGRQFDKGIVNNDIIVNETAVRKMNMTQPLGKWIENGKQRSRIIGIVRDFHFRKMNEEIKPVFIYKDSTWWKKLVIMRLSGGDKTLTIDKIREMFRDFAPGYPVSYSFLDQEVSKYYEDERKLRSLINSATILSIMISCIGLFGLSVFTVKRREREIGLRKVNGATGLNMLALLIWEFGRLILISMAVALPAGYLIAGKWLESYAYHIKIRPQFFFITFILITVLALGTVGFHTLRAASLNPVDTLREE
jgi:putative ABC transport system permease protein